MSYMAKLVKDELTVFNIPCDKLDRENLPDQWLGRFSASAAEGPLVQVA